MWIVTSASISGPTATGIFHPRQADGRAIDGRIVLALQGLNVFGHRRLVLVRDDLLQAGQANFLVAVGQRRVDQRVHAGRGIDPAQGLDVEHAHVAAIVACPDYLASARAAYGSSIALILASA